MDYVVIDGDSALFKPNFAAALVVVLPGTLRGSGPATFGQRKLCVVGDESSVAVRGCAYTTATHSVPGTGTLEIAALAADQRAQNACTGGTAWLLVGSEFVAKFTVQQPAQQPSPGGPVPDPVPQYPGSGRFVSLNTKLRAG